MVAKGRNRSRTLAGTPTRLRHAAASADLDDAGFHQLLELCGHLDVGEVLLGGSRVLLHVAQHLCVCVFGGGTG